MAGRVSAWRISAAPASPEALRAPSVVPSSTTPFRVMPRM
jgi:hypothetical protein